MTDLELMELAARRAAGRLHHSEQRILNVLADELLRVCLEKDRLHTDECQCRECRPS